MNEAPLKPVYIYGLFDETGIRYIGQSAKPKERFDKHRYDKGATHKGNWIRKRFSEGKTPELKILEETDERRYKEREQAWISFGRRVGWRLTNATDGGEGVCGFHHSDETRKKLSDIFIGKPLSAEHYKNMTAATRSEKVRRKMSQAGSGRKLSSQWIQNIAAAQIGKPKHSDESRHKISVAHLGKKLSEEHRRSLSESHKGHKHSEEHRRKISESNIGRKHSVEHREKITAALQSVEARKRMSEAQRARRAREHQ